MLFFTVSFTNGAKVFSKLNNCNIRQALYKIVFIRWTLPPSYRLTLLIFPLPLAKVSPSFPIPHSQTSSTNASAENSLR